MPPPHAPNRPIHDARAAETEMTYAPPTDIAAAEDSIALHLPPPQETDHWRVLHINLPCGETAALCQTRRGSRGKWTNFTLVAVSLHLRRLGLRGLGLYNCIDTDTPSGAKKQQSIGRYEGDTLGRYNTENATDEAAIQAAQHSEYIMVVFRNGRWCVVDAANAGPPFLQYANDPYPDGVPTLDVLIDGTFMVDNAAASFSFTAPLD